MIELSILFRCMQFYAHNAHNLVSGNSFFSDHSFLGDLYDTYSSIYDDVIERMIGLGVKIDAPTLVKIQVEAVNKLSKADNNIFTTLLSLESEACQMIQSYISVNELSEGTRQMLGDICDKSEIRQYKIKQRVS